MNNMSIAYRALISEVGLLLNEPDIRPADNFVALGGNSFLAVLVAANLKDKQGLEINAAQLLGDTLENIQIKLIDTISEMTV